MKTIEHKIRVTQDLLAELISQLEDAKKSPFWRNRDGHIVPIKDMPNEYLIYCLRICANCGVSAVSKRRWDMDAERMQSFVDMINEATARQIPQDAWRLG